MSKLTATYKPKREKRPTKGGSNLLFRIIFGGQELPDETLPTQLDPWRIRVAQYCGIMSEMVYWDADKRDLPPELGEVIFDERVTAKYRIPYFIVNSDQLNRIFVACRGSWSLDDLFVDAQAKCKAWKEGWAHKGALKSAIFLYSTIRLLVKTISEGYGNRPVTITGHSLGAGVAALMVEMFRDEFPEMKVNGLTFAPVAALSRNVWERTRHHTMSFVTEGDFVPFLSLHNFRKMFSKGDKATKAVMIKQLGKEVGKERRMSIVESKRVKMLEEGKKLERKAEIPLPPPTLEDALDSPTAKHSCSIPLFPPGQIYILALEKDDKGEREIRLKKPKDIRYFDKFVSNMNGKRHSILLYNDWLDCLFRSVPSELGPFFPERDELKCQRKEKKRAQRKARQQRKKMLEEAAKICRKAEKCMKHEEEKQKKQGKRKHMTECEAEDGPVGPVGPSPSEPSLAVFDMSEPETPSGTSDTSSTRASETNDSDRETTSSTSDPSHSGTSDDEVSNESEYSEDQEDMREESSEEITFD